MKKMRLLIGIIPVFLIVVLLCNKSVSRIIEVKSNSYSAPVNSAFADEEFYECVVNAYNKENYTSLGYDVSLTDEQLKSIKSLSCYSNINDARGIEKMVDLKSLTLSNNSLTEIDLSHNTSLTALNLSYDQLTNIDLSHNTSLTALNLNDNQLTNIDLSNNTSLTELDFNDNQFTNINLSHNMALKSLNLSKNKLTNIDLSNNTSLTELNLSNNQLTNIDLSHNTSLTELNLSNNQLTNIDLIHNTSLTKLNLNNNQFSNIDLSDYTSLTVVYLDSNQLTDMELSNNTSLTVLYLSNNQLSNIDLSNNISLVTLDLSGNQFTNIDLSHNTSLIYLYLSNNQLTNIDLSRYTSLTELDLSNNQLTNINLSHDIALTELYLGENQLTNINLSHNMALESLNLSKNKLTNIDLSQNTVLKNLILDNNQFTEIDLSNNTVLEKLSLSNTKLKEINLRDKTKLKALYLGKNKLTSIDLSYNEDLIYIDLHSNKLTEIDLSNNKQLRTLIINNNKLTSFDMSQNENLELVYLTGNYLTYIDLSGTNGKSPFHPTQSRTYYVLNNDFSVIDDQEILEGLQASEDLRNKYVVQYPYIDSFGNEKKFDFEYYMDCFSLTSDIYEIDSNNSYIYVGLEQDEEIIKDNLFFRGYREIRGVIEDNHYIIRDFAVDDDLITIDLVNIKSDKYDLTKNYLMGNIEDIVNNVTVTNGSFTYDSVKNVFQVKYNDSVLQEFDYVSYSSEKYDLSKDFIKVNDSDISSFLSNINCLNCDLYIYNGTENVTTGDFGDGYKLRVMYDDELIKEYDLKYSVLGVNLDKKNLKLNLNSKKTSQLSANIIPSAAENKNVTWLSSDSSIASVDENGLVTAKALGSATITVKTEDGDFTDTCDVTVVDTIIYTVTFKNGNDVYTSQFEEGNEVLFKTDLSKTGYNLVGWKYNNQNYSLTDKLLMPGNDIELEAVWELSVPEIKNYASDGNRITGISLKTNVEGLNLGIDSIYQVKVSKHDGSTKTSGLVGTGDKVKVYLDNQLVSEYDVIIKGDITGTGTSTVSDVAKLYQYMKGKVTMDDCYVKAGNVVDNDNIIKVNDVAKLYQFIKGKISNL